MAKFAFLSPEWFLEVRRLQAEHGPVLPPEADLRMNLRVTETPFGTTASSIWRPRRRRGVG